MNAYAQTTRYVERRARPGQLLADIELAILRHLATGHRDDEIAVALEISTRTYRRYLAALMRKLPAVTRAHAVAIAIERGLITKLPGGAR